MTEEKLAALMEFKDKVSIFMNFDVIEMTTQAQSLDEFIRKKMSESQAQAVVIAVENANKNMMDMVSPFETRILQQMDSLVREAAQTRGQLNRVNDLKADFVLLAEKLLEKPSHEEVDAKMTKLHNYTPLKAFQGL